MALCRPSAGQPGFASAVVLGVIALLMAGELVHRFLAPRPIHFNQAIGVTVVGLLVNLTCAFLLNGGHAHRPHHPGRGPGDHGHPHHDLNLRAAYLHVLADAFTSVTAIVALTAGKFLGWSRLDPGMGFVGSVVVSAWAYGLVRDTSGILLDRTPASSDLPDEIRRAIESDGDSLIADLHVWQVGAGRAAPTGGSPGPDRAGPTDPGDNRRPGRVVARQIQAFQGTALGADSVHRRVRP